MFYKILDKSTFEKDWFSWFNNNRNHAFVFSHISLISSAKSNTPLTRYLFLICLIIFALSLFFQFWANSIENPQVLSAKPHFFILTALPFSFEITMFSLGLVVFIRFLFINSSKNKQIPWHIKEILLELDEQHILLVSSKSFPDGDEQKNY